ncbi:LysR family transcriptional regulator [Peterkaempfera sp. SMS 1(5)a]|uniref:LysR family transcriptional regulator n=1 Tax=Peterkaempfera podocarpi TaxID=3232308 RepID=UPI00366A6C59
MAVDLGTRRLRYFIAQQSLSRQIRELESELGVALLERTTKRVSLTDAGEVFLGDARRLVAEAEAAVERVRLAAAGKSAVLRLGFIPVGLRAPAQRVLTSFEQRHPEVKIQLQETSWQDPSAGLLSGSSDAAVVLLPNGLTGLDTVHIQTSEACVALPQGHPLTAFDTITAEQLRELPLVGYDVPTVSFLDRWNIGEPAVRARSVHQWLAEVATGQGIGVTAAEYSEHRAVHGVVFRRAVGLTGMTIGFAVRAGDPNPLVREFLRHARRTDVRNTDEAGTAGGPAARS